MGNSHRHAHEKVPVILVGGIDGTFKGNRHLVFPDNTQRTSNMLLSLLHLYGIEMDKIGTSNGRLQPLEMVWLTESSRWRRVRARAGGRARRPLRAVRRSRGSSAQLGRATRPNVTPPQGPVRQVIFKSCTSCHGIDDYAYNARDRAAWDALLTAKHHGLTSRSRPRIEPRSLTGWLSDSARRRSRSRERMSRLSSPPFSPTPRARRLLKRACTTCHGLERVNGARFAPERWRVVTVDMRERGAQAGRRGARAARRMAGPHQRHERQ